MAVVSVTTIPPGGVATPTGDLSFTQDSTSFTIFPSSGAGATIPSATNTLAGALDAARAGQHDNIISHNPALATAALATAAYSSGLGSSGLSVILDGHGSALTSGLTRYIQCPFAATITGWAVLADVSGSISIDIRKAAFANFPPTAGNSITGGSPPFITSGVSNQSSSLTGWSTTSIAAGDCIAFYISSVATITVAFVLLKITHS